MTFARISRALGAVGLILLATPSQGQSLGGTPGVIGAPQPGTTPLSPVPSAGPSAPMVPVEPGELGSFSEQLMATLALTPAQREKVDAAQAARKTMWADNQVSRRAEFDALSRELKRGADFDPRAVNVMRTNARKVMQERMDRVQDLWLVFWDSLDLKQRAKLVDYMTQQHERHGRIRRSGP